MKRSRLSEQGQHRSTLHPDCAALLQHVESGPHASTIAIRLLSHIATVAFPSKAAGIRAKRRQSLRQLASGLLPQSLESSLHTAATALASLPTDTASEQISKLYEALLGTHSKGISNSRTIQGAFYTPSSLVDFLVSQTVGSMASRSSLRICDPACGTGNFLIAAATALGSTPHTWNSLYGVDIDPAAVQICRWRIWLASSCHAQVWTTLCENICAGDSLGGPPPNLIGSSRTQWLRSAPQPPLQGHSWHSNPSLSTHGNWLGFDVILGNPPFLSQLASPTSHDLTRQAWLKHRYAELIQPYTDAAAIFLAHSIELLRPGGRLGLVLPASVLSTRDCHSIRQYAARHTTFQSVWINPARSFPGVNVLTCALVAQRIEQRAKLDSQPIQTFVGPACRKGKALRLSREHLISANTWGMFTQELAGIPRVRVSRQRTLVDIAVATADFRDQYYGLSGHIVERAQPASPAFAPLITSGLIDLAACLWSQRSTRILKHTWQSPQVNIDSLRALTALGPWIDQRRVPKVLLATQTRILEPWVDVQGNTLPCVPLITITPRDPSESQALWLIAAVLASPVASAMAIVEFAGAALSATAIKLSAKQCLSLPLPAESDMESMAAAFRRIASPDASADDLQHFAETSVAAYSIPRGKVSAILSWWIPLANRSRFGGSDKTATPFT